MTKTKKDIESIEDVQLLVDSFYDKIREDKLLKDIFNGIIKDQWPEHLEKMYRFWQTILLYEHTYSGSPFKPHSNLPIEKLHFDRWLKLFKQTINEHFSGKNADEAYERAEKMAIMFNYKIEYIKDNPHKKVLK